MVVQTTNGIGDIPVMLFKFHVRQLNMVVSIYQWC